MPLFCTFANQRPFYTQNPWITIVNILTLYTYLHFVYCIVHFHGNLRQRQIDTEVLCLDAFYTLPFFLLSHNASHPILKYIDAFDARICNTVTILVAYSCSFSNLSELVHPSHTTEAYSNIGLIKVQNIFEIFVLHKIYLSFLISPNFVQA